MEGEIIILKEYVNEEWAKGELKGASGIFPLNFVEIIEDLPGLGTSISAVCKCKQVYHLVVLAIAMISYIRH